MNRLISGLLLTTLLLFVRAAPCQVTRPVSYDDFDTSVTVTSGVGDATALKNLIQGNTVNFIYLRNGTYTLANPVYINRSTSLYIHGQDRMRVVLVAQDPTQPLFIVQAATILNFAGLYIQPTKNAPTTTLNRWLWLQNTTPVTLEVMDCFAPATTAWLNGPGTANFQQDTMPMWGYTDAAILVDDPGMDVFVIQGDWGFGNYLVSGISDSAWIWQKRGRIKVHSVNFEGQVGTCAIRIESPGGALGPHYIVDNRSEGNNGADFGKRQACLVYTPPTTAAVDIVMKSDYISPMAGPAYAFLTGVTGTFNPGSVVTIGGLMNTQAMVTDWNAGTGRINFNTNGGHINSDNVTVTTWPVADTNPADWVGKTVSQSSPTAASGTLNHWDATKAWNNGVIANYNGGGTVWIIGVQSDHEGNHLVTGTPAAGAKIISIGNVMTTTTYDGTTGGNATFLSFDDMNSSDWTAASMMSGVLVSNDADFTQPTPRWTTYPSAPGSIWTYLQTAGNTVPEPPLETVPMPLTRPSMPTHALPGMVDLKATFNAKGDGVTDDTAAFQAAWNSLCSGTTALRAPNFWIAPGTYIIQSQTKLFGLGACSAVGGWIAGAGHTQTVLKMAPGYKHGIIRSDGIGYSTIQGIGFQADPWTTDIYFQSGTLIPGTKTLTNLQSHYNSPTQPATWTVGMNVTGLGIPAGTTIASVQSQSAVTLSNYAVCGTQVSANGSTAANSNTITGITPTGVSIGMLVSGWTIPPNEFVTAVGANAVTITTGTGVAASHSPYAIAFTSMAPITATGTLNGRVSNNTTSIAMSSVAGLSAGMSVIGSGIPYYATISATNSGCGTTPCILVKLLAGFTNVGTGSQTLTFSSCNWNAWITSQPQEGLLETTMLNGNTQQMAFYDLAFDGGFAGYATGTHYPDGANCSSEGIYNSSFKNEGYGFAQGHANVIADGVDAATFTNNYFDQGFYYDGTPVGGAPSYPMSYHVTSTGVKYYTLGSYFYDLTSDQPVWEHQGWTQYPQTTFFDQSSLSPRPAGGPSWLGGTTVWTLGGATGPIFLHSNVTKTGPANFQGGANGAQPYMIKLWSTVGDWSSITTYPPNAVTDKTN